MKAAFIFLARGAEPAAHTAVIDTPSVSLTVVGVKNYEEAVAVASALIDKGIQAIELCGGFGHEGVAAICRAVKDRAVVGAVRFDGHPGLKGKSGDSVFL